METDDAPPLPVPPADKKAFWDKAKKRLGEVPAHASACATKAAKLGKQGLEVTRDALETGKQAYAGSKLESKVKDTAGAVVGKLDQVTGKRLIELVEQKLKIQDAYNDVLATRLAEALKRIEKLEARSNDD